MDSPADSYARSRRRTRFPQLAEFESLLGFELDPFQRDACEALEEGHGVLVCAPTGAGKTVVGEFAVHLALHEQQSCAYTTPIKALSNQKYADLVRRYGADKVGLLTGDNSINAHAPILVMTTEVLRNMLYVGSDTVSRLGYVVMDEVHYLADRFRGAVWEEVIIHLPERVRIASLSATVSNAEEFGEWLRTVRGDTKVIVSEDRPVPLWQHMLVGRRLYDLLAEKSTNRGRSRAVNPELARAAREQQQRTSFRGGRRNAWKPPRRTDVVEVLDRRGLLPVIYFIFSRVGCDAAVEQCRRSGVRLLSAPERELVQQIAARHTAGLSAGDLDVLGYWEWLEALEMGYAAHHAGMIPAFKEAVEELFVLGLCKVVFATETLALGINMPARSVVLERLVKYNGESHNPLTPGEYTQLTGRAGRRGIDIEGHAVTLWGPEVNPVEVATLATTRTFPLQSSFRPTYNMAVNLVEALGREHSREVLERSFAQFQADRSVVGLAKKRDELASAADVQAAEVSCERGDVAEYADLRYELSSLEKASARDRSAQDRSRVLASLGKLRRGDIIAIPSGRRRGLAVVTEVSRDRDSAVVHVLTDGRWAGRIDPSSFHGPVVPLGSMKVKASYQHRSAQSRRDLASALASATRSVTLHKSPPKRDKAMPPELAELRRRIAAHPVHDCPDRERHVREYEKGAALRRKLDRIEDRFEGRTTSLARTFDRICDVLEELGYLTDAGGRERVTPDGRMLARIWSESDLLIAECVRNGLWSDLRPAELAAVVSAVLFEPRTGSGFQTTTTPVGSRRVRSVLGAMNGEWNRLNKLTTSAGAPTIRQPEPGFCLAIYRWAVGDSLGAVLRNLADAGAEISPGDFVRWSRQVIDVLEQLARLPEDDRHAELVATARSAVATIRRGVLADLGAPAPSDPEHDPEVDETSIEEDDVVDETALAEDIGHADEASLMTEDFVLGGDKRTD